MGSWAPRHQRSRLVPVGQEGERPKGGRCAAAGALDNATTARCLLSVFSTDHAAHGHAGAPDQERESLDRRDPKPPV